MDLTQKHCVPCEGGTPPLSEEKEETLKKQVVQWMLFRDGTHRLQRQFKFKNFKEAMIFVNKVAEVAEAEGHHPDVYMFYNRVRLQLTTHAIGGLSTNDFILAVKVDALL